jgi:hypothetical protein
MALTPQQRVLRARLGGLQTRANGTTNTAAARKAFNDRFYEGVPENLPQAERDRRAEAARKAHMTRLALRSSISRASKKSRL